MAAASPSGGSPSRAGASSSSSSHEQIVDVFVAIQRSGPAEDGRGHEGAASAANAAAARRQERRGQQRRRRCSFDRGRRHGHALSRGQELAVRSFAAEAGHEIVDELLGRTGGPVDVGREGGGELLAVVVLVGLKG